ncbi:MAG: serine/threonine protein kinase with repeat [Myxococcales bacterium]|nr:serine/threonine protein kinase with repeat [Myxococcales bacterium]
MGRADDDAEAPTLAQLGTPVPTLAEHSASLPAFEQLMAGAMIGRYCLVQRLGAGAMGVVWSAHDPQLDRRIAIKLVHPTLSRSEEAASRLLREARAMAKLSHRAVVTVHDAGEVDGQLFIAMELVNGTNLGTMLRARNPDAIADWRRWLAMMLEAGRGLEAAHHSNVLHRDFKPDNVLVDESGRVCVGDFGLATLGAETFAAVLSARAIKSSILDLTTTGALLGTPAYMSPQQLRSEMVDARADQFSFCVATWEALYGTRPFLVTSTGIDAVPALADLIDSGTIEEPPADCEVPPAVREVLRRGLSADPEDRWPDMGALLAALTAAAAPAKRAQSVFRPAARGRRRYVVIVAALGVAAAIAAFAVGRRGVSGPAAPAALPVERSVTAKKLFNVSLRTGLALSQDGTRFGLASDRLQVRSLDGQEWSALLPHGGDEVTQLELDGDYLYFGLRSGSGPYRWSYTGDGSMSLVGTDKGGMWLGRTTLGDLIHTIEDQRLSIIDGDRTVRSWDVSAGVDATLASPDRTKVAYIESTRFTGKIIVRDIVPDRRFVSESLVSPTSVSWLDDTTLLYATGTLEQPRIYRVSIAGDRFGTPVEIYGLEAGWFGPMRVHADRLYLILMQPTPRGRLVDRTGGASSSSYLDLASVSLGWLTDREFLSWSSNTHRIERRATTTTIELTKAVLDGEAANATTAGDVVIASVRKTAGRQTIGVSRSTGAQLWRHGDGKTLAVRCAGDLKPPCYAIRVLEHEDQVVTIVPETGELGTTPVHRGKVEDLAVSLDGTKIVLVGKRSEAIEIDPTGAVLSTSLLPLTTLRSVAYDPRGGILVGGTLTRNNFQVGQFHNGEWKLLAQSDDDILSFVRPSPDGNRVLVLARVYAPEVWQLQLPATR